MRAVVAFLLLGVALNAVSGGNIGFRFAVKQSGLSTFTDAIVAIVNSRFSDMSLPDMHLDEHVPIVGHITLDLTDIKVTGFSIPGAAVQTVGPDALSTSIDGVTLAITMAFHWRKVHWPHLSDHGNIRAVPRQGDLALTAAISPDAAGHPHLTLLGSAAAFDKIDIHFSGHWDSWLLNLLSGLFESTIKHTVNDAINGQLSTLVDSTLNGMMQHIPTVLPFGTGHDACTLDVGLLAVNAVTNTYISMGNDFTVVNTATGVVCPFVPVPLPVEVDSSRMVQLWVAQSPMDCALWVAYVNGGLTQHMQSNTNQWTDIIPQLQTLYPNAVLNELIYAQSVPQFAFTPAGVQLGLSLALNHSVVLADGSSKFTDSLGLEFSFGIKAWVGPGSSTPSSLYANITETQLTFQVLATDIGTIDLGLLQLLVDIVVPIAVEMLNKYLNAGFPLPVSTGITLINPQVSFLSGYAGVAADIHYSPSALLAQYDATQNHN